MIIKGIMSYPTLFTPRKATPDGDPKFGVNILLPKTDPQLAAVNQAIQAQINEGLQGNLGNGRLCLKDCDVEYPDNPVVHRAPLIVLMLLILLIVNRSWIRLKSMVAPKHILRSLLPATRCRCQKV